MNKSLIAILLGIVLTGFGCTPEPEIARYRVHKDRSGLDKLRQADQPPFVKSPTVSAVKVQETRMAVAIFEEVDATWFFKIAGRPDKVDASEKQWMSFFESVNFKDKKPTWKLPKRWSTAGVKPMRFATLVIDDDPPPLELAVSILGPNQNMLDNVNRWRSQIGLNDISESELDDHLETRKSDSGRFLLFDSVGIGPGVMTPPFASRDAAPFAAGSQAVSPNAKLDYDLPEGWSKLDSSIMVPVRLQKVVGDAKAQITIVELPADANEWEPNVIRWANQVGLGGLSKSQLEARTSDLKIDDVEGKAIDLLDPDSETKTAMIGAMVKRKGSAWFLKLMGDKQVVRESRVAFNRFAQSIRFR